MDVRLSPEQLQLRDSAAQVVGRLGPHTVAELDDRQRGAKLDAAIASSGWRELRTPDERGEPWATAVAVCLVAEQLARGRADAAFLGETLAAELRRLAGAPDADTPQTVALLPDLSAPALRGDPAVAPDVFGDTSALVLVDEGGGFSLASVVVRGQGCGVDLTRPVAPIDTASAALVADQVKPVTNDELTRWTALGLATACADLVGTMQGALDLSVEYAKQRRQYGRSIGSFQALQHLLADAAVHLEGSRSTALHAAWAVDALEPADALGYAAAAKAYCARGARVVCETAIQVHGGIGNTWDCLAHVHLRRALLSTDLLGGVGPSLARVLEHSGIAPDKAAADGLR
jgi:alkylation response protein AidB-like acyl-CoA dehydrogenase